MPRPIAKTVLAVLGWLLLLATIPAGAASAPGACSVTQAQRDVNAAKRAVRRADARLREARHVLSATKSATERYGSRVGRWTRLSRRVGWPWRAFPTLMYVIHRESRGDPNAKNPASTASGLLQFLSGWWAGKWSPFDPKQNLRHGYKAWRDVGWQPWGL